MDSEKVLPRDMRFETYIRDHTDDVIGEVDRLRHNKPFRGDIIDANFELESLENMEIMASLAYWINKEIIPDSDRASYETMYRTIMFVNQVSRFVHKGEVLAFNAGRYLEQVIPLEDSFGQLADDVSVYLNDNPGIRELLDYYSGELDGGRSHTDLVELSGGLVFMLIERSKAERFIAE